MDLSLKLTINSDPRLLSVVRGAVARLASVVGFPEPDCRAITQAVDEAMCNIIRHAYGGESDHWVELSCQHRGNTLEFTLTDHGKPVDPGRVCSRSLDEVKPGGLGTHIIQSVMDQVRYESLPDRNELRLVKHLKKTAGRAS